ncbi:uncharacterized protein LOC26529325 [Drosophila willistoni]|uniref:uncharacterized protein LOC26529325 n=1 Tax=Drosophila willistoni TaxID=7260 RepID=UPI001F0783E4|nr:uncharacterized protein LOC26529325 [Drosophila willistoni]
MGPSHRNRSFVYPAVIVVVLHITLQLRCIDSSIQMQQQSVENEYTTYEQPQEKMEQMKTIKDQKLIVRLPSNSLLKYTSYKDVSILHFRMPQDSRTAIFSFKAFEESKGTFQRKCKVKDVTLHLKAGSYPVISPENITFPKHFLSSEQRFEIYNLQFQSNEQEQRIKVNGPYIGNWFAVAFVSWTDPNNDRIEQQGLAASCDTLLLGEMSVSSFKPIIINNGQAHQGNLTSNDFAQQQQQQQPTQYNRGVNVSNSSPDNISQATAVDNLTPDENFIVQNFYSNRPARALPPKQQSQHSHSPKGDAQSGGVSIKATESAQTKNFTHTEFLSRVEDGGNTNNNSKSNNSNSNTECSENNEIIYKFYVPDDIGVATVRISFAQVCVNCADVGFHVQANAYPWSGCGSGDSCRESNHIHSTVIRPNQTEEISIEFYVQPSTWHYATLKFVSETDEIWLCAAGADKPTESSVLTASMKELLGARLNQRTKSQYRLRRQNTNSINTESSPNVLGYEIRIDFDLPKSINTSLEARNESNTVNSWQPNRFRNMDFYPLLRQTYREFFMFDYDLQPDTNGTVPVVLNLTAQSAAGFAFDVGEVYDIGGTLTYAVSMKHGSRSSSDIKSPPPTLSPSSERGGILAERLIGDPNSVVEPGQSSRTNQSMQIIVCMQLGEPGVPTWPDKCRYGQRLRQASIIVNNTESMGLVHVPFPESGRWYVTMGLYCHGAETARVTIIESVKDFIRQHVRLLDDMNFPCPCASSAKRYATCIESNDCLAKMNETETLKVKECMMDFKCTPDYEDTTRLFEIHHKSATEQHVALDNCNTSVIFSISSSPCVAGRCGRYGRCFHYMSGGFVFSTCVCTKGYRGWDCTEDS